MGNFPDGLFCWWNLLDGYFSWWAFFRDSSQPSVPYIKLCFPHCQPFCMCKLVKQYSLFLGRDGGICIIYQYKTLSKTDVLYTLSVPLWHMVSGRTRSYDPSPKREGARVFMSLWSVCLSVSLPVCVYNSQTITIGSWFISTRWVHSSHSPPQKWFGTVFGLFLSFLGTFTCINSKLFTRLVL